MKSQKQHNKPRHYVPFYVFVVLFVCSYAFIEMYTSMYNHMMSMQTLSPKRIVQKITAKERDLKLPPEYDSFESFLEDAFIRYPQLKQKFDNEKLAKRFTHIKAVIKMYYHFVRGEFKEIYSALIEKERDCAEKEYRALLEDLFIYYNNLLPSNKLALQEAVILHDIGLGYEGRDVIHPERGAKIAHDIFIKKGYSYDFSEKASAIIRDHGVCADIGATYFLHELTEKSVQEQWLMQLIAFFDGAGKPAGNIMLKAKLVLLMNLEAAISQYGEFYNYRFQHLLGPDLHRNEGELGKQKIDQLIDKLIPKDELPQFKENYNRVIRIFAPPLFSDIVSHSQGPGRYEYFVKFIKLISQLTTLFKLQSPDTAYISIDTDIDFMPMSDQARIPYFDALKDILNNIPDTITIEDVAKDLFKHKNTKAFGLPIHFDAQEKSIVINLSKLYTPKAASLAKKIMNKLISAASSLIDKARSAPEIIGKNA